ncbi:hypothetical protein T439DRAFT_359138 [Meredithblackwellia eburnea MCA 4105]
MYFSLSNSLAITLGLLSMVLGVTAGSSSYSVSGPLAAKGEMKSGKSTIGQCKLYVPWTGSSDDNKVLLQKAGDNITAIAENLKDGSGNTALADKPAGDASNAETIHYTYLLVKSASQAEYEKADFSKGTTPITLNGLRSIAMACQQEALQPESS